MRGVTTGYLKPIGKTPSNKEQFTRFVIEGNKISRHSFTRLGMNYKVLSKSNVLQLIDKLSLVLENVAPSFH